MARLIFDSISKYYFLLVFDNSARKAIIRIPTAKATRAPISLVKFSYKKRALKINYKYGFAPSQKPESPKLVHQ